VNAGSVPKQYQTSDQCCESTCRLLCSTPTNILLFCETDRGSGKTDSQCRDTVVRCDADCSRLGSHCVTAACDCVTGSSCSSKDSICTPGLCKEPKICRSDGQSYTCSCPDGFSGEDCRNIVRIPCTDHTCRGELLYDLFININIVSKV